MIIGWEQIPTQSAIAQSKIEILTQSKKYIESINKSIKSNLEKKKLQVLTHNFVLQCLCE